MITERRLEELEDVARDFQNLYSFDKGDVPYITEMAELRPSELLEISRLARLYTVENRDKLVAREGERLEDSVARFVRKRDAMKEVDKLIDRIRKELR